ncbi:hypothetical protein M514_00458 [Trichuris suis]|uniref:Uncharacterized protein n=1 Tax=Trichuris suis TaxID=68888 RepID=A0A085MNG9_9BILA|nr:hypothetical protein M513_00458 [Trichuris suis]KFD72044.1 hypothetical protein M514_00458 [Trichuris suis]
MAIGDELFGKRLKAAFGAPSWTNGKKSIGRSLIENCERPCNRLCFHQEPLQSVVSTDSAAIFKRGMLFTQATNPQLLTTNRSNLKKLQLGKSSKQTRTVLLRMVCLRIRRSFVPEKYKLFQSMRINPLHTLSIAWPFKEVVVQFYDDLYELKSSKD